MAEVIAARRTALMRSWVENPGILVQATSAEDAAKVFRNNTQAAVEPLGKRLKKNAAIVRYAGDRDAEATLWVRGSYRDYQGAYMAFVRHEYGCVDAAPASLAYDVDHLMNRRRFQLDVMVRVEAVPATANQAWGRLFEKASSRPHFYANWGRDRRSMSYMICAKVGGEMPPSGQGDEAGIARLTQFFATELGLHPEETESGLRNMLEFAYRPPTA